MKNIETLISESEEIANKKADGHLSILKFTTGYKVFLGTPNLDIGEEREKVSKLNSYKTLKEALIDFIANPVNIYDI